MTTRPRYRSIKGGQTPWAVPDWLQPFVSLIPQPFYAFVVTRDTPYEKWVYAAAIVLIVQLGLIGALTGAALTAAYDEWFDAEQPATTDDTMPEILPPDEPPSEPGGIYPYYQPTPAPADFELPPADLRYVPDIDYYKVALQSALFTLWNTRGVYAGTAGWDPGDAVYTVDGELRYEQPCDGALVELENVPEKLGGLSFNAQIYCVPRAGSLVFFKDTWFDERQKVELIKGVYVPRNIARADGFQLTVKPGVEAVAIPFVCGIAIDP